MADNEEVSVITHLLEIEKQASSVINAAAVECDRKISNAKINAEQEFKKQYAVEAEKLQNDFDVKKNEILHNHEAVMNSYKKSVEQKNQDKEKFQDFLNKVLFE